MNISGKTVVILACTSMAANGMVTKPNQTPSLPSTINRRDTLSKTFGILGLGLATSTPFIPLIANAEVAEETPRVTSRMGGLLVRNRQYNEK